MSAWLGMVGIQSIERGIRREDDLAYADAAGYHDKFHRTGPPTASEEDMGHTVLGDLTIQNWQPKNGMSGLAKAALALGTLGLAGVAAWKLLDLIPKPTPEPGKTVIKTVPGTDTDFTVKTPIIRE